MDGSFVERFADPGRVAGRVRRPSERGQRSVQVRFRHAFVAVPEIDHFLDGRDADCVDEGCRPVFGAGFPLLDLAADEDVEGELAGHEAFLARVFGHFAEVFDCEVGVVGGEGSVAGLVATVEFEVGGAGDVVV